MHDPSERQARLVDRLQDAIDILGGRHVARRQGDPRPHPFEGLDRLAGRLRRTRPAHQHQMPSPSLDHPTGQPKAKRPAAAGDEVRRIGEKPRQARSRRGPLQSPESLDEPSPVAEGYLVLSILICELFDQFVPVLRGRKFGEVDPGAPEFRVLQRDHPAEPPERRTHQATGTRRDLADGLRVASDEAEPRTIGARGLGEGLNDRQHCETPETLGVRTRNP